MRSKFDNQLALLNEQLMAMGALCESGIATVTRALMTQDTALADAAIAIERDIDQKEREIESLCLKMLLQQQPVASDLRTISSALKMITDMERIGDQAADIGEIVKATDLSGSTSHVHIVEMAKASIHMVTGSIDAFVNKSTEAAAAIIAYDDIVDELFNKVKADIIHIVSTATDKSEQAVDLLMIAKYLERIGDHAVNIAEWVVFSITGKHKE